MSEAATSYSQRRVLKFAAVFAILFGVATVVSGGRVLFGPAEARVAAGAYVPFVLWFNFAAGFAYVFAGIALVRQVRWAATAATAIAVATAVVYLLFGLHVAGGGAFELRTALAMAVRTIFWTFTAAVSTKHLKQLEGPS